MSYPIPENELQRLQALRELQVLDSAQEPDFDTLVLLARDLFDVPIGLISLVDQKRQWFKAAVGLEVDETEREAAFCNYTIMSGEPFVVPDASLDERFRENTFVTGDPEIRFYAGVPLAITPDVNLGSLCIIDRRPRQIDSKGLEQLRRLGDLAESLLRQRKAAAETSELSRDVIRQAALISEQSGSIATQRRILECASKLAKMGAWELNVQTGDLTWSDGMFALHEMERTQTLKIGEHLKLYPEPDRSRLKAVMERSRLDGSPYTFEGRMLTAKGNLRWIRLVCDVELKNGQEIRRFGMKQDITEEKALADRLRRLAQRDDLTGLYNRTILTEKLTELGGDSNRSEGQVYLYLIDLDGFKDVNDTHGHVAGDVCLRRIARRARAMIGKHGLIARIGGDEFAVLVHGESRSSIYDVIERIQYAVAKPVRWREQTFQLTASIGVAFREANQSVHPGELIREADLALYEAKDSGRNCHRVFQPALFAMVAEKFDTLRDVRRALTESEFELYYQPKIILANGRHAGFEALLRWNKPGEAVLAPGSFVAALEDPALSKEIGDFVIGAALDQAERWHRANVPFKSIAINLSASQFRDPAFAKRFLSSIASRNLQASMIEVEVTEGVFLSKATDNVLSACRTLKKAGVRIAFDDFGTGFASLSHLRDFPVDIIKIDRSFISDLTAGGNATAIVNAMVGLGLNLSMNIVAEGVETSAQAEFLTAIGCDLAQGYLFGRPMPAPAAARFSQRPKERVKTA